MPGMLVARVPRRVPQAFARRGNEVRRGVEHISGRNERFPRVTAGLLRTQAPDVARASA